MKSYLFGLLVFVPATALAQEQPQPTAAPTPAAASATQPVTPATTQRGALVVTWHALLPLSDQPHLYAGLGVGVSAEGWLSKNVALGGSLEFTKFIVDDYFDDSALGPGVEGYSVLFLPRLSGALRYAPVDLAKGVYFGVSVDAIGRRVSYNVRTSAEKLSDTTFFAGVTPSVGLRWKALDVGLRYQYVADDDGASFLGLVVGGQVAAF